MLKEIREMEKRMHRCLEIMGINAKLGSVGVGKEQCPNPFNFSQSEDERNKRCPKVASRLQASLQR